MFIYHTKSTNIILNMIFYTYMSWFKAVIKSKSTNMRMSTNSLNPCDFSHLLHFCCSSCL